MKPVSLSVRLRTVAAMVTVGNRVCDVGCDHGFVPIFLVTQGISPEVLAMDVKKGPLSAANRHIAEYGLGEVIHTRLSDGLHNYNIGEADTLICAGMGGRLMMRILADDKGKTESFRELILQPQSEIEQFRRWLRLQGYCITDENMIEEDNKFYPMMRVETKASMPESNNVRDCIMDGKILCKLTDRYGSILLQRRDKTLARYLEREERIYAEILEELQAQGLSDEKRNSRYTEVSKLLGECREALEIVTK